MPMAVGAFVAAAVPGALGITAAGIIGWAAAGATFLAISYGLSAASAALMGRPKIGAGSRAREMVIRTTTGPRGIVYGEVTTGGTLVFVGTTGLKNEFMDFVIAVAGHEVEAITDVWFDDVKIPLADIASGSAVGGAVGGTGDYRPRDGDPVAYVYKFTGRSDQVASATLYTSVTGYTEWTTAHRLQGTAYVHIRLVRNNKAYEQGPPQNFRFGVKGAKVYDPRLDSTNGGTGTHRLADARTWAWSNNPALIVADYITGGTLTNDLETPVRKRGFGASTDDVDWSYVIAAANICDESVAIPGGTQVRYTCDGVVYPSEDTPDADCLESLLTSMLGQVTYTAGKYRIYAGAYQTPTYTLNETDLAGPVTFQTAKGRADRHNVVRGTRYDGEQGVAVEFLPRTDSSYQAIDGRALYHDIELPCTTNEYRAQRIAQTILRRSREQKTLIWAGQASAAKVAVWETVYVTCGELGLSNKVFRCIERKTRFASGEDAPLVELTLREEFASTYADPLTGDYGSVTVATDPGPTPDALDEPTLLTATPLYTAIEFRWTPGASPIPLGVQFELYEHSASTPFSSATLIWIGTATTAVIAKDDTIPRYYWVRAARGNAASATEPAVTGLAAAALGTVEGSGQYTLIDHGSGTIEKGADYFIKSSGAFDWNTGCYTAEGYYNGAYLSARATITVYGVMIGLNSDPTTDASYTSIDYAWYAVDGFAYIYESGGGQGQFGSFTAGTIFQIHYDGAFVKYFKDGILMREVATTANRLFYLDSSIAYPGDGWNQVRFGPAGAAGEDGIDALTMSVVPDSIAIPCNSAGIPNTGAFPVAVAYTVYSGPDNVTAQVSPTVVTSSCTVSYQGAGSYSVTGMSADTAYFDLTAVLSGQGSVKKRVTLTKVRAGSAATAQSDTSLSVNNTTAYDGNTQGGEITLSLGTGGTVTFSVQHEYTSTGTGRMAGKFQYRTTPGSGGWTDVAAEYVDPFVAAPGEPSIYANVAYLAGPVSPDSWEFRYVNRRAQFTQIAHGSWGEFTVEWKA
jgi:hypothetical protein